MSLVVFPFKEEDADVVVSNLATASRHPRIDEVWAVGADLGETMKALLEPACEISASSAPVLIFPQERIGSLRPGKGDGMNTALRLAAERGFDRVHFYDADIVNFDASWIDGAEAAADRGYEVVRHRFPRAATDAMITWMITRPGLAKLFPGTILPRLGQPLGGELLLTREVVEALAAETLVRERSDWGIDTVITYTTAVLGRGLYEHNIPSGKRHALYGSLEELRDMAVECLDAVASLSGRRRPDPETAYDSDPPSPAPDDLKRTVGYDADATKPLLTRDWSKPELELLEMLPTHVAAGMARNRVNPTFAFMDEGAWGETLDVLLSEFSLGDTAWRSLAFRLWLARVLAYTVGPASLGYDHAISYLEWTIDAYERAAADLV